MAEYNYGDAKIGEGKAIYVKTRVIGQCKKTANAQTAHWLLPDTQAKAQKTKRAVFCQRSYEIVKNNLITFYLTK